MYNLRREGDGAGDYGGMSEAIWEDENGIQIEQNARPRVGIRLRRNDRRNMVGFYWTEN